MSKAKKRPVIESDSDDSDAGDLDQDLLSLASAAKRPKPTPTSTQTSGSDSSSESGSDAEWTLDGKGGGRKKIKGKKGRVAVKGQQQKKPMTTKKLPAPSSSNSSVEEENEGEQQSASGGGRSSSGSSSSDSESSSEESLKFDDGLDDELVGDEEDRRKLNLMTEAEREQEMYNRYEKRQALKARFEIEQKIRRERKAKKRRQRELQQKRLFREKRARKEDKTKSRAIDELIAKRTADKQKRAEAEKQAQQQSLLQQRREPLKTSDVFTSGSDEESSTSSSSPTDHGDSDDEAGTKSLSDLRSSAPRYISTVEEISKLKLSRFRLEKWVHMPFFEDTVKGCFVRIGIGAHEGRMVYRVCEIVGVQETPKVYSLGSAKTNKGLRLRHGLQERVFRIEYISNSPFAETEFSKWKAEMENRGLPLPTVEHVKRKSKQIDEARNFQFKEEDIEKIIKEKQKFRKTPRNYAMTKSRLLRDKELAEQEGDVGRVASIAQQLEEIEERADLLDKQRTKGLSAISYINERNRQGNVTRAEQALKEEMSGEKKMADPFTRRKCQPTLVTLTKESQFPGAALLLHKLSQAKTEEDKEAIKAALKEQAPQLLSPTTPDGQNSSFFSSIKETPDVGKLSSTPVLPTQELKSERLDDLFSAHDFDIQIDLPSGPEGPPAVKVVPKATPPQKNEGPRRSLNLADYKKRRGLI